MNFYSPLILLVSFASSGLFASLRFSPVSSPL